MVCVCDAHCSSKMLHCSACTTPRCQCNVMILSEFGQPPSPFVRYSNGTISPAPVWADSRTVATLNEALRFVSSVTTHSCMAWLNVQRIKIIECHKSRHFLPSVFGRIRTVDERTKLNWIEMEMLCCDNWMSFCVFRCAIWPARARARAHVMCDNFVCSAEEKNRSNLLF